MPLKAPALKSVYDWTGFYVGGHFGYGGGSLGPGTNPLPEQGVLFPHSVTGLIGGWQVGYQPRSSPTASCSASKPMSTVHQPARPLRIRRMPPAPFNTTIDYIGTARGRIGYAFDRIMPYVTGGFAWGHTHVNINDGSGATVDAGHPDSAGPPAPASSSRSAATGAPRLEYDYVDLDAADATISAISGLPGVNVDPRIHLLKLGLNYHLGDTPLDAGAARSRAAGIRHLERPRADHLPAAGLSGVPLALCRAATACPAADSCRRPGPRRRSSA